MKKIIAGLFAGLMLTMSAQALAAYNCEDGVCTGAQRPVVLLWRQLVLRQ